jgi:hypothetical protein
MANSVESHFVARRATGVCRGGLPSCPAPEWRYFVAIKIGRRQGLPSRIGVKEASLNPYLTERPSGGHLRRIANSAASSRKRCTKKPGEGSAGLSCRDNAGRARTSSAGSLGTPCHDDRGRSDTVALRRRPEHCRSQTHRKDSWSTRRSNRTSIRRSRNR